MSNINLELRKLADTTGLQPCLGLVEPDTGKLSRDIRDGLTAPLGFPRLGEFLFSGDRVVFAVHSGIGEVGVVLRTLLEEIGKAWDPDAGQITLLFSDRASEHNYRENVGSDFPRVRTAVQEGTADAVLALLGADDDNLPILVNRLVFDADVLIPIVRAHDEARAFHQEVLWSFTDSATKKRWRAMSGNNQIAYSELACGLAGILVSVDIIIGPGDFPYGVVIGKPQAKEAAVQERIADAWRTPKSNQADAIVISIDDARDRNSWRAVRDAIVAAHAIQVDCPLVILSHIDHAPPNEWRAEFSPDKPLSSSVAKFDPELKQSVVGRTIHFRSALAPEVSRDMGWNPVQWDESLEHLLAVFQSPILLRDPQRSEIVHEGSQITSGEAKTSRQSKPKKKPVRQRSSGRKKA